MIRTLILFVTFTLRATAADHQKNSPDSRNMIEAEQAILALLTGIRWEKADHPKSILKPLRQPPVITLSHPKELSSTLRRRKPPLPHP